MGGEKRSDRLDYYFPQGSPPRRRGKADKDDVSGLDLGITPAWAGKRGFVSNMRQDCQDHPRVGGEKISMSSTVFFWQGSPPHGRGKDAEFVVTVAGGGITPAWAGKSRTSTGSCHFWEDHPRMGGEKPVAMHSLTTKAGSPPRGRGKGWPPPPLGLSPRITPAWAGKRRERSSCRTNRRDHPRVGGEKVYRPTADPNNHGSPPRRRGKEEG